jgi:hypothetical protein
MSSRLRLEKKPGPFLPPAVLAAAFVVTAAAGVYCRM